MSTAEEINAAAATMRTYSGPAAGPIANLLETVLLTSREACPPHAECESWCTPETCDLAAALTAARAISGGQR